MYTIAALILLAIVLGIVMDIVNAVLKTIGLDGVLSKIPVVGAQLTVAVSILLVWLFDIRLVEHYAGEMRTAWIQIVVDGILVAGMVPVKDAVVGAIEKGVRA